MGRGERYKLKLISTLGAVLLMTACSGRGSNAAGMAVPAAPPASVQDSGVAIEGFSFKPATLNVRRNARVVWTQKDNTTHTVTSGSAGPIDPMTGQAKTEADGRFASGDLRQGATYEFTFSQPGTYTYFCSYHPEGMRGQIVVSE